MFLSIGRRKIYNRTSPRLGQNKQAFKTRLRQRLLDRHNNRHHQTNPSLEAIHTNTQHGNPATGSDNPTLRRGQSWASPALERRHMASWTTGLAPPLVPRPPQLTASLDPCPSQDTPTSVSQNPSRTPGLAPAKASGREVSK